MIKELLLKEHSRQNMEKVADLTGDNPELFRELMSSLFSDDIRETQHAAWAMTTVLGRHPELGEPHLQKMINRLKDPVHDAVKRAITRYLQEVHIPEYLLGEVWENCAALLTNASVPIAPKVFSMTVLYRIVQKWPELAGELRFMIEEQLPFGSAGFRNRGMKILGKLKNADQRF